MMTISPLMPVYPRCDVRPVRGDGCYLIDESGKRFLDFASGIAVNILGHSHPHLISAIQKQAATLRSEEHTSELQSLMRISYAVFCLTTKKQPLHNRTISHHAIYHS